MKKNPINYDEMVSLQADLPGYQDPAITSYQERKYPAKCNIDGDPFFYHTGDMYIEEFEKSKQQRKENKSKLKSRGIL